MKKKLSVFLVMILCAALILGGCGSKEEEGPVFDPSLEGTWVYNFHDIFLGFDSEGTVSYETPDSAGQLSYFFDGSYLELSDGDRLIGTGSINDDGNIEFDGLNGCFRPEGGNAYEPLPASESNLVIPNSELGENRTVLINSAVFFNTEQDYYERVPADWVVLSAEPEISDGYKTISVIVACYIPQSNVPLIAFPFQYSGGLYIYDKYTGYVFSTNSYYEVDENDYMYSFDSEQGRTELSFHRESETSGPYGDCYDIFTYSYTFRFPEWYDGLMIAPVPQPDNVEELLNNLDELDMPLGLSVLPYSNGRVESGLRYNIK